MAAASLLGQVVFQAKTASHGDELWKSDGTAAGTVMIKDIYPSTQSSDAGNSPPDGKGFAFMNGELFFQASDGVVNTELWKTDGTTDGTVLVKDIRFGAPVYGSYPECFAVVGSTLYFQAGNNNAGNNGVELWKSDGTADGTVMVKDINDGISNAFPVNSNPECATIAFDNKVFFQAQDGTNGYELWKSDGTADGTVMVKNIRAGSGSSSPFKFVVMGNTLYFRANDGVSGSGLWKTDGTTDGTTFVTAVSMMGQPVVFNGKLFFAADGTSGGELWSSDGTKDGTAMFADINPNPNPKGVGDGLGSEPSDLTVFNGKLYFAADDGTNGRELWVSDGTADGTTLLKDIYPGASDGSPESFAVVNNKLFFSARAGIDGAQLWMTDGTAGGTAVVKDTFSSGPKHLIGIPFPPPPPAPPPPPSSPAPSPPPLPGSTAAIVSFTVAGTISDFDEAKLATICDKIANAAQLSPEDAKCTAKAASVVITATLTVPSGNTVQAVTDNLNAALGSPALATSALGVTVEVAPTVVDSSGATVSPASAGGLGTGALIGIIVGAVVAVVAILAIVWFMKKKKKTATAKMSESRV